MMRYYDIIDTLEDIRKIKTMARAFETENAKEYIAHLERLEAAYLKELAKRKKPEGPVYRKNQVRDWREKLNGKFI